MAKLTRYRRSSTKQSSIVKFSDRGYAYSDLGLSKIGGLVTFFNNGDRPNLRDIPEGILIYNLDSNCLEISDPYNDQWISICPGSLSGSDLILGPPTDNTYLDGALGLNPSGTISDAIDEINEYLLLLSSGSFTYASHLGTFDGSTNGNLEDPIFVLGRVSSPTSTGSPFYTGGFDNDTNRDLTQSPILTWELAAGQRITELDHGIISGIYSTGSGIKHIEVLTLDGTTSPQSSLPSGYISVSSLLSIGMRKEGFLSSDIPVDLLLDNNSGYLKIEISHSVPSGIYSNVPLEFFNDSGGQPTFIDKAVTYSGGPVRHLSGVGFATISGSSRPVLIFTVSGGGVWSDTYRSDPLLVNSNQFGIPTYVVNYNSSTVTKNGFSPPVSPFKFNEDFIYLEAKEVTSTGLVNPDSSGNYKTVSLTIRDPFNIVAGVPFEPVPRILLNTYPIQSDDSGEFFYDEEYRLKTTSSGTGSMTSISGTGRGIDAWDSTESLVSNNALQVINGELVYPSEDFSNTVPSGNPDYTVLGSGIGNLTYIRRFRDSLGSARSNGVLRIEGMTEGDRISGTILVDLRVVGAHITGSGIQGPGNEGTGWLSLNTDYNSGTFLGDDGDGCFVTVGGYLAPDFEFTLGGFSTVFAYNEAIELRVTFTDPSALNKNIKTLHITDWN